MGLRCVCQQQFHRFGGVDRRFPDERSDGRLEPLPCRVRRHPSLGAFPKPTLYNNIPPSAPFSLFTDEKSPALVPATTYDATATLATLYLVDVFTSSTGTLRIGTITGAVGAETYTAGTS